MRLWIGPKFPPLRRSREHPKDSRESTAKTVRFSDGRIVKFRKKKGKKSQNPETGGRLSEVNIKRAKKEFLKLSEKKRAEIDNPQAYIFKIAWDIQKGRFGKYHHR